MRSYLKTAIGLCLGIAITAVVLVAARRPAAADNAPTGTFTIAILQVTFSDQTAASHAFDLSTLVQAGAEITQYYSQLSYGKLQLVIKTAGVSLTNPQAYYYAHCNIDNAPAYDRCDQYTKDAVSAYLNPASPNLAPDPHFFDDVNGVAVLMTGTNNQFTRGPLDVGIGHEVQASYLEEEAYPLNSSNNFGPSNVSWQGWVHEFGHEMQFAANLNVGGNWNGHPSAYWSGYDLMDSCYPCDQSPYGLLGPPYVNNNEGAFPAWLDAGHVAVVPIPTTGNPVVGQTFVLPPLGQSIANPVVQAVKVPVDGQRYYLVNVRTQTGVDALQQLQGGCSFRTRGICDVGVQIQLINESNDPPLLPCMPDYAQPGCGPLPPPVGTPPQAGWPYHLWHVNQTFVDSVNQIQIAVVGQRDDGYTVEINRQVPANIPDLFITPWLTPPMNTYESIDIWVDSSCNGYLDQGGVLKYGVRPDNTVIGNGDDPCANHENRIYATVHNIGQVASTPTTVLFEATNPLGIGVSGAWQTVNSAPLPAIAPGASQTVYVTWTPKVNLTSSEINNKHFSFHSCVRVTVQPTNQQVITTNNQAQENIDYFEAVTGPGPIHFPNITRSIYLTNLYSDRYGINSDPHRMFTLHAVSHLPPGWTYILNNGQRNVFLKPGETTSVPITIVPTTAEVGKIYAFRADASTQHWLTNSAFTTTDPRYKHFSYGSVGGVELQAHTVYATHLGLQAKFTDGRVVTVSGALQPARPSTTLAIDYTDPAGMTTTRLVKTDAMGRYEDHFALTKKGSWQIRSIWQGDMLYQSAVSPIVTLR